MIVSVPFFYDLDVLLPRSSKERTFQIGDRHPTMITEVRDAILVARLPVAGGATHDVVHHDGAFWRSVSDLDPTDVVDEQKAKETFEASKRHHRLRLFSGERYHSYEYFADIGEATHRQVVASRRSEATTAIDAAAKDYIVAEGRLMRRIEEPVIKSDIEGSMNLRHVVSYRSKDTNDDPGAYWNLGEYDAMVAFYQELFDLGGIARPELPAPELHRPDLLVWNRNRELLWKTLDQELQDFVKIHLVEADVNALVAYASLRDHLRSADRSSDGQARIAYLYAQEIASSCIDPTGRHRPFSSSLSIGERINDTSEDMQQLASFS